MISFTSILTTIKGASLATKVGLGVGAVAIIAGGIAETVAIINASQPHEETQIVASSPNDDNSPSKQEDTQIGETGEAEDGNNKGEQVADDKKPTTTTNSKPQTTTQKPSNNSISNNQPNNASLTPKPSAPVAQPSQPTQPSTRPSQPTQPSKPSTTPSQPQQPVQPVQPSEPEKKPNYNLNDNYAIALCGGIVNGQDVSFQVIDKSPDTAMNSCVAKIYNEARKHSEYASMSDEELSNEVLSNEVLSMGSAGPLDEDMCTRNSLSCGRW